MTSTHAVMGTVGYFAPEQAQGGPVDERCDLFSLGVVLYRACSGQMPFAADNLLAYVSALGGTTPPRSLGELRPDLPPALIELIHRLLARNAKDRRGSAHEVAEELKRLLVPPPLPPLPVAPAPRSWGWTTAVLLLLLLPPAVYIAVLGTTPRGHPKPAEHPLLGSLAGRSRDI